MVRASILTSFLAAVSAALADRRFIPGGYIFEAEDGHVSLTDLEGRIPQLLTWSGRGIRGSSSGRPWHHTNAFQL